MFVSLPLVVYYSIAACITLAIPGECSTINATPEVSCFLGGWSAKWEADQKFDIEDVDATLCSRLIYCFAGVDKPNYTISDRGLLAFSSGAYPRLMSLKQSNPSLKINLGIGGHEERAERISEMAASSQLRKVFVDSVVEFLRKNEFDGIVLSWQDPKSRDRRNYGTLLKMLRTAFEPFNFELGIVISKDKSILNSGYDLRTIYREADSVYVVTYDYHGCWQDVTGHTAALYPRPDHADAERQANMNYTLSYLVSNGAPLEKLVPGIPFYGRIYELLNSSFSGVGAVTLPDSSFKDDCAIGYNEICERRQKRGPRWTFRWDQYQRVPYMYQDNQWISYDNTKSIREKLELAKSLGIRNAMVWTISFDDFRGWCKDGVHFPLLREVNSVMGRRVPTPVRPSPAPALPDAARELPLEMRIGFEIEGCSVAVTADVSVNILTCGGHTDGECGAKGRVPELTVVHASCWGTAHLVLRCNSDGYWRTHSNDGGNDEGKMKTICQPQNLNSAVCGRRPRYKRTGTQLNFKKENIWPWVVGLKRREHYACSATLISPSHLLTAAHCLVRSPDEIYEAIDVRNLKIQFTDHKVHDIFAHTISLHPQYQPGPLPKNDIAIIGLERPLVFSADLYPACVDLSNRFFVSTAHAVTFDRAPGEQLHKYSLLLQELDASCTSPRHPCRVDGFTDSQFCGADINGEKFLSQGSSGGPYLYNFGTDASEEWAITGIVSSHSQRDICRTPHNIFTAVSSYATWIQGILSGGLLA